MTPARGGSAVADPGVAPPIPPDHPAALALEAGSLEAARAAVDGCRACDLWARATQGVFGAGTTRARLMLVGEQPGDNEDLAGQPFVGPAGRLLDAALAEAGIDREQAFVTNVVKHFKWRPSGSAGSTTSRTASRFGRAVRGSTSRSSSSARSSWCCSGRRRPRPSSVRRSG